MDQLIKAMPFKHENQGSVLRNSVERLIVI